MSFHRNAQQVCSDGSKTAYVPAKAEIYKYCDCSAANSSIIAKTDVFHNYIHQEQRNTSQSEWHCQFHSCTPLVKFY